MHLSVQGWVLLLFLIQQFKIAASRTLPPLTCDHAVMLDVVISGTNINCYKSPLKSSQPLMLCQSKPVYSGVELLHLLSPENLNIT